ncbi:MAG: carbon-nitrogen hydrolase family protein [Hyphomonadaceae bacterium]|nr:carbon-nitrogen hydrolase family protein [Hyphomonadaceae bacterium]
MRAACIQLCSTDDRQANLAASENLIRAAHDKGAKFIATPENTSLIENSKSRLFEVVTPEENSIEVAFFSSLAKELRVNLLIGGMPIKISDSKAANRSFIFGKDGQIKARYDKMHMFDVQINEEETWLESATYQAGLKPTLVDVGEFKLGMTICYDLRFADLYKYYAMNGANIISVPSAFTRPTGKAHWKSLLRARAIETSSYVIAPAQGGEHNKSRSTWGHSLIISPWGKVVASIDHDQPGYCVADLSMAEVQKTRAQIPAWNQLTTLPE